MGRLGALGLASCLAIACTSREPEEAKADPGSAAHAEPSAVEPGAIAPQDDESPLNPPSTPVLDLHVVARSRSALRLFSTTDGTLFVLANTEAVRIPDSGAIGREPQYLRGLSDPGELGMVLWRTTAFGGRFPDALYMVVETEAERFAAPPQVYRFADSAWRQLGNRKGGLAWMYRGFSAWQDGATLALRGWQLPETLDDEQYSEQKWKAIERAIAKATPREFELLGAKKAAPPHFGDVTMLAFASLPEGDVVAIAGGASLHWAPPTIEPRRVEIGGVLPSAPRLQMLAADDVWMYDEHELRHFDGSAWTIVATPNDAAVVGLADAGATEWLVQGSIWASSADANVLYKRENGGEWQPLALPSIPFPSDSSAQFLYWSGGYEPVPTDAGEGRVRQPLVAMDVVAHKGELWVTARGPAYDSDAGEFRWALLHTKDRGTVVELPDPETMRRELLDLRPDVPFLGRTDCEVFVPIAVDDVNGDHAELHDALDEIALPAGGGMVLLEVQRRGKPAIGVLVLVDDSEGGRAPKVAREIVAAVRDAIGPRVGKPVCQLVIARRNLGDWSE